MTFIVSDPFYAKHLTGKGHPESPERYHTVILNLTKNGLLTPANHITPRTATEEEILLCHTAKYVEILKENMALCAVSGRVKGDYTLSTGDVQICPESYSVALLAVGGALSAIDAVMREKAMNAFCVVRPPGHHATSNCGMGFCLLNNVAIGARYVQKKYGLKRVAIVDWDVHHGNGTQEIFYDDPSVFYFSTHQYPFYPGTGSELEKGEGAGLGTTLNCPIAPTTHSRIKVLEAFKNKLTEAMKAFQPEFVLISAGFDAHEEDLLGQFNLKTEDFVQLTEIVKEIADQYTEGRLVSVLEGGYHLPALAECAVAHVKALNIYNKK